MHDMHTGCMWHACGMHGVHVGCMWDACVMHDIHVGCMWDGGGGGHKHFLRIRGLETRESISFATPVASDLSSRNLGISHIFNMIGVSPWTMLSRNLSRLWVGFASTSLLVLNMPRLVPRAT